jgi:hypothetical protein
MPKEALMSSVTTIVPGAREPGMLSTFGALDAGMPQGPSTMDAVTTAERQREGGGAPGQRRRLRVPAPATRVGGRLHELLTATRALFGWRFRTNHV